MNSIHITRGVTNSKVVNPSIIDDTARPISNPGCEHASAEMESNNHSDIDTVAFQIPSEHGPVQTTNEVVDNPFFVQLVDKLLSFRPEAIDAPQFRRDLMSAVWGCIPDSCRDTTTISMLPPGTYEACLKTLAAFIPPEKGTLTAPMTSLAIALGDNKWEARDINCSVEDLLKLLLPVDFEARVASLTDLPYGAASINTILRQCFDFSAVSKMGSSSLAAYIAPGQGNTFRDHWDPLMRMTVIPLIILYALKIPEAQEENKAEETVNREGEAKIWSAIADLKDMQAQILTLMQKQESHRTDNSILGGAVTSGTPLTHDSHHIRGHQKGTDKRDSKKIWWDDNLGQGKELVDEIESSSDDSYDVSTRRNYTRAPPMIRKKLELTVKGKTSTEARFESDVHYLWANSHKTTDGFIEDFVKGIKDCSLPYIAFDGSKVFLGISTGKEQLQGPPKYDMNPLSEQFSRIQAIDAPVRPDQILDSLMEAMRSVGSERRIWADLHSFFLEVLNQVSTSHDLKMPLWIEIALMVAYHRMHMKIMLLDINDMHTSLLYDMFYEVVPNNVNWSTRPHWRLTAQVMNALIVLRHLCVSHALPHVIIKGTGTCAKCIGKRHESAVNDSAKTTNKYYVLNKNGVAEFARWKAQLTAQITQNTVKDFLKIGNNRADYGNKEEKGKLPITNMTELFKVVLANHQYSMYSA